MFTSSVFFVSCAASSMLSGSALITKSTPLLSMANFPPSTQRRVPETLPLLVLALTCLPNDWLRSSSNVR
ncbi:Uncharacterised protein [uncultured archaeon]|nr:Uncharacterised protein [uncultured archaeon]